MAYWRIPSAIVLLAFVLTSGFARADDLAIAREHFDKGTTLYDLQRYAEAAREYELAFEAKHDPALLFNIGQAYRFAADYGKAIGAFRSYLRRVPQARNRAEVEERIVEMQRLLEAQKRSGDQPPAGTLLPVEGKPGDAPTNAVGKRTAPPSAGVLPLPPREAALLEHAPSAPLVATLVKSIAIDTRARRPRTERLAGIGVASGGVVLLALGGVFVALAKSANDDATAGAVYHGSAADRRDAFQSADLACFVIGGVAIATGLTLYLLGRRDAPKVMATAPETNRAATFALRF